MLHLITLSRHSQYYCNKIYSFIIPYMITKLMPIHVLLCNYNHVIHTQEFAYINVCNNQIFTEIRWCFVPLMLIKHILNIYLQQYYAIHKHI